MNLWERAKHLWKLSEYSPGQPNEEYTEGAEVSMIVKKPEKKHEKIFIAREAIDPIKDLVNEKPV